MKVVALETSKYFTRGRIYLYAGQLSGSNQVLLFDDNAKIQALSQEELFNNFSVLTFDTNFEEVNK